MLKKGLLSIILTMGFFFSVFAAAITAGGSTAIYPIMSKWAKSYSQETNEEINYQPIGSGGGIQGLTNSTFTFAASDMPLASQQLQKNNWLQFPVVISSIITIINLPGFKTNQIVLSGQVIADIYLNHVQYWDDPAIQALNKGLTFPHTMIIPIHRADASGTTYNFTHYLSDVSPTWQKAIAFDTQVSWPGISLGAKGNAGVAAQVQSIPGAIGYVEYAYVLQNNLTYTKLVNAEGAVVAANPDSFAAAAKNAHWNKAKDFDLVLTNQPGKTTWPIVQTTFILLPISTSADTVAVIHFFRWCFEGNGKTMAASLDYVPLPDTVVSLIKKQWQAQIIL